MKMLLKLTMPIEPFNSMIKKGTIGKTIEKILSDLKPEAVYFTLDNGDRSVLMVVNISKPNDYVKYAEPFFLEFNASVKYDIAMSPEELASAGLDALGKKYA